MKLKSLILGATLLGTAVSFTSCSGGGSSSTWGSYTSPYVSASQFVSGLNSYDINYAGPSAVVLNTDETVRSTWDSEDWFVIYDGNQGEYKAVSLQYVRSIVYQAYYSNTYDLAGQFRNYEAQDQNNGLYDGDYYGNDYEDVTYNSYDGYYYGQVTGYKYEDEVESHDVNLIASEKEELALYKKVSRISYTYKVSLQAATSLAKLGDKVEVMLKKGADQQELTADDQAILTKDLESITGVTLQEVVAVGNDQDKKAEVLKKISSKMGTTPQNLEEHLIPELLGGQL